MSRHHALIAAMIIALGVRVWAEEPVPHERIVPVGQVRAVVLAIGDEDVAREWEKRWNGALTYYAHLYQTPDRWPLSVSSEALGSPDVPPGQHAVVLGFCEPAEAERQVGFIRTFYPEARAIPVTARPIACAQLWPGTRLFRTHSVESNGWRLLMNVYLADAEPVKYEGGRRTPYDPNAGVLYVSTGLLDPRQFVRSYGDRLVYACVADALQQPSRCILRTEVKDGKIVLDLTWRKEPIPCNPSVYYQKIRNTYSINGREVGEALRVLAEKSSSSCGE